MFSATSSFVLVRPRWKNLARRPWLASDRLDAIAREGEPLGQAFGALSAPLGTIAVAGNPIFYAGWRTVRRVIEDLGRTVLVNETMPRAGDWRSLVSLVSGLLSR
jgi:hypothetical protein